MAVGVPLPEISVSPASSPDPTVEPFSPFSGSFATVKEEPDSFRPIHLTPPPSATRPRQMSPLRPLDSVPQGHGLEKQRFEALLRASRERQAALAAKRDHDDLRKEIALKTHKNKQVERRALFLSKVLAPPSPTATSLPKTPPESPAIFHYTLPSPGLASPLSLFESLETPSTGSATKTSWVEQVDFRLPPKGVAAKEANMGTPKPAAASVIAAPRQLPSLAQISARLSSSNSRSSSNESNGNRLPPFLSAPRRLPTPPSERPPLPVSVGRLNMPIRAPKPISPGELMLPPLSPTSPLTPKIQVTTTLVPRTAAMSPTQLTEINLETFNAHSREQRSKNMLSTIRKRQSIPSERVLTGHDTEFHSGPKFLKRHSAPAGDLSAERARIWGSAPVPGGF